MRITFDWYEGKHDLILLKVERHWTWQEMVDTQYSINQKLDAVDVETVHIIVDTSASDGLPTGMIQMIPRLFNVRHPKRGATIVVGASSVIEQMWQLITNIFPPAGIPRSVFVSTMAQALTSYEDIQAQNTAD